jgi:hypothetical protein
MGFDFQLIAYRGDRLEDEHVATILLENAASVGLFRHGPARGIRLDDLYCVALYEGPSERTHTIELAPVTPAIDRNASLASVLQAAWRQSVAAIKALPPKDARPSAETPPNEADDGDGLALARALSQLTGTAYWLCQGDHSCVGGYARFDRGALVDPVRHEDIFVDGDGYIDIPASRWSDALRTKANPEALFFATFPDEDGPPLRSTSNPRRKIRFDPEQHEVSLE